MVVTIVASRLGGAMTNVGSVHESFFVAPVLTLNLQIGCFRPIDAKCC